jgi:hypothetical protein
MVDEANLSGQYVYCRPSKPFHAFVVLGQQRFHAFVALGQQLFHAFVAPGQHRFHAFVVPGQQRFHAFVAPGQQRFHAFVVLGHLCGCSAVCHSRSCNSQNQDVVHNATAARRSAS